VTTMSQPPASDGLSAATASCAAANAAVRSALLLETTTRAFVVSRERTLRFVQACTENLRAKVATAWFYAEHLLTRTGALRTAIVDGGASVMALEIESF